MAIYLAALKPIIKSAGLLLTYVMAVYVNGTLLEWNNGNEFEMQKRADVAFDKAMQNPRYKGKVIVSEIYVVGGDSNIVTKVPGGKSATNMVGANSVKGMENARNILSPEEAERKLKEAEDLLNARGVKWEPMVVGRSANIILDTSPFNVGDRVRVIGDYNRGKEGTITTFSFDKSGLGVRYDGQGQYDDQDVFRPEELMKI